MALGFNSVFRYSINRSGLGLLYLPLSPEVRKRIKLFIDVFIDRFGRAAAAFVILLFTAESIDFGLRGTALAVVIITGVCLVVAVRLRNSYVEAFRQQLALREMDLESQSRFVTDPASVRLLVGTLESAQERQILYALRLLQSVRGVDFAPQLLPLLNHASPYVREEATRTLRALPGEFRAEAGTAVNGRCPGSAAGGCRIPVRGGIRPGRRQSSSSSCVTKISTSAWRQHTTHQGAAISGPPLNSFEIC